MRIAQFSMLGLLVCGSIAYAQGPAFDCAQAKSEVENAICADADLSALDQRLAERYSAALDVAARLDAGAVAATEDLRATQRGWLAGRDECWKADDLSACVMDAYLRREGALVALWMLEPSSATDFWMCNGDPANEVVTMYFATPTPSVRFERGDTIDAGTLVPTASGSKYEGSFGREIWIKGDEATYREPDPDGATFTCARTTDR